MRVLVVLTILVIGLGGHTVDSGTRHIDSVASQDQFMFCFSEKCGMPVSFLEVIVLFRGSVHHFDSRVMGAPMGRIPQNQKDLKL